MATTTRRAFTAHTSQAKVEASRKFDLGQIHKGKKALNWSDDDYRFHLRNVTGASSSATLDAQGRAKLLAHMAACGFKPAPSTPKVFDQAAKIAWLWRKLGEASGLRDPSEAAMLAFVTRTTGTQYSALKFIPVAHASTVIEALKAMLDRAKAAKAAQHASTQKVQP